MPDYSAISGDSFYISADSGEDAALKYFAHIEGKDCSCGYASCNCVQEGETVTIIQEIPDRNLMGDLPVDNSSC